MQILSDLASGAARVLRADAGAGERRPRESLAEPRLGRNLSELRSHQSTETPLQYAVTKVAELIAPPYQAIDDERPAGCPVNKHSLKDYVRAVLGMKHVSAKINPALAPYLDELSKNESRFGTQPVTLSSFTLLCVLCMADQVPGPGYGQFGREAFMGWLNRQLAPDTTAPYDCIPERYFDKVQVRRNPETGFTNRCAVRYGRDNAQSVDVRALHRAHLQNVRLQFAYLQGADLRGANLKFTLLADANLRSANLQGANLRGANLRRADLRGADLQGADLAYADFHGVDLRGAKLSVSPEFAVGIVFSGSSRNLTGTSLLLSTDEAASSCQHYVAARMANWNAVLFDLALNSRNHDGRSVLINIADLDDSCRDIKQALMRAVVEELDGARETPRADAVARLIPSLGDVLFEDPEYLRGYEAFSAWLRGGLLGDGSTPLDTGLSDAALDALGGHVARVLIGAQGIDASAGHSVAIYQVLYAMRERAESASSPEVGGKWLAQSQALHEQYCRALGDALPTLMGANGVHENERAILFDDDAFPLISADGQACVIMTGPYYRQLVLGDRSRASEEGGNVAWDRLRCVQGSAGTFPASVNDPNDPGQGGTRGTASTAAVLEQFPLLRAALHREKATTAQDRMLALAGLPAAGDLKLLERFTAALKRSHMIDPSEKMTDGRHQAALIDVFATKIEDRGGQAHLAPEHSESLQAQWRDDSKRTFAFRLLCMAALYTNYSSTRIFGEELDSPNALRTYTEALLRKAHELGPDLFLAANPQPVQPPVDQSADWLQRLNGQAFDCTAVLYGMESTNLLNILRQEPPNSPLHRVWNEMIPPAWREGH